MRKAAEWPAESDRLKLEVDTLEDVIKRKDAEIAKLRAALERISEMKGEDLYYASGLPHDNAAAAYATSILEQNT